MEDIKQEKYIKDFIEPVSLEGTEKILFQMKNSICKIHKKNGITGTGFLCKIRHNYQKDFIPALITNNHVLNEEDIANNNNILITFNNENENIIINIDDLRKKYTSSKLDITFIEIKANKDKIDVNNFLEINDNIYKNKMFLETALIQKSIYIIHYPKGKNIKVSYGLLLNLNGNEIKHSCITEEGSSGAPIISLETNKVIGIHYGTSKKDSFKFNIGIFFKYLINQFIYHTKMLDEANNLKKIYIISESNIIPLDIKSSNTIDIITEKIKKEMDQMMNTQLNIWLLKKRD